MWDEKEVTEQKTRVSWALASVGAPEDPGGAGPVLMVSPGPQLPWGMSPGPISYFQLSQTHGLPSLSSGPFPLVSDLSLQTHKSVHGENTHHPHPTSQQWVSALGQAREGQGTTRAQALQAEALRQGRAADLSGVKGQGRVSVAWPGRHLEGVAGRVKSGRERALPAPLTPQEGARPACALPCHWQT